MSTAEDLYRLTAWLLDGENNPHPKILGSETLKAAVKNQIGELTAFNGHKYGFGAGVVTDPSGRTKEIYWSGAPYNAYFWIDCGTRQLGILPTNTGPHRHRNILNAFRQAASPAE